MAEDLEMTSLVHHLGGHEDLGVAVRGQPHEPRRPLERRGLTHAVVAEGGDEPLPLWVVQAEIDRVGVAPVGPPAQVSLDRTEPELERLHLLDECVLVEEVRVEVLVVGHHHQAGTLGD